VEQAPLQPRQADKITWTLTPSGDYTTSSAYKAQFVDFAANQALATIWNKWAPPKCKFFAWLIFQNRVWTYDRLAQRNWDHSLMCPQCRATPETTLHLFAECRYSCRVWPVVANWLGLHNLLPSKCTPTTSTSDRWLSITMTPNTPRKGSRSITLLVGWEIWKERNRRIFDRRESSVPSVVNRIKAKASLWITAGSKCLAALFVSE
jgi:hypothetical protein